MKKDQPPNTRSTPRKYPFAYFVIFAGLIVAAAGGAWFFHDRMPPPPVSSSCRGCNVLLITIDTLRADRVGAFGGRQGLTPNIDRLASEGLRLTRTYTSAPLTLPAHASILTAVSPPVHGLRTNGLFRLGQSPPTLATILKRAGYRSGAFVGSFVLDARFGLNRGFDVYDDRYGEARPGNPADSAERRADDVVAAALAWILQPAPSSRPWFAWVHLYDPHEPYRAPEPYTSRYAPYDAEVAYTDAAVGRFLDRLRTAGQLDSTLVIVAADHGESLGEHGERTHGVFTYEATMRVPWIVWAGSRLSPAASDVLARLIDVAPTALDIIGLGAPPEFEGHSIAAAIGARNSTAASAYFEAMDANLTRNWAPLTGIVSGNYKLIDLPRPELYDLASDSSETTNLYSKQPERARVLDALLRDAAARFAAEASTAQKTTLGADARQRLQALGYVGASASARQRSYTDADDPKTLIVAANDLDRALADFKSGAYQRAMASVRSIRETYPGFTTASGVLASMQHDTGDLAGAIATLDGLLRAETADPSVVVVLAGYLQEAGELDRARALLEALIASDPEYADAYNSLGVVYSKLGKHAQAQSTFRTVLELDPTSATAHENLGVDAAAAGDLPGAAASLSRALELDPNLAGAHNAFAAVLLRQGRREDALEHWRTAVQLNPRSYDALYNLGTVLYSSGRKEEARPYLEQFVAGAPAGRYRADIDRLRAMLVR